MLIGTEEIHEDLQRTIPIVGQYVVNGPSANAFGSMIAKQMARTLRGPDWAPYRIGEMHLVGSAFEGITVVQLQSTYATRIECSRVYGIITEPGTNWDKTDLKIRVATNPHSLVQKLDVNCTISSIIDVSERLLNTLRFTRADGVFDNSTGQLVHPDNRVLTRR